MEGPAGADVRERKGRPQQAKEITIHAEATTILPFLYSALLVKLEK